MEFVGGEGEVEGQVHTKSRAVHKCGPAWARKFFVEVGFLALDRRDCLRAILLVVLCGPVPTTFDAHHRLTEIAPSILGVVTEIRTTAKRGGAGAHHPQITGDGQDMIMRTKGVEETLSRLIISTNGTHNCTERTLSDM